MQKQLHDFRQLLSEVITAEAASKVTAEGKTVFTSWSEAKKLLQSDVRYSRLSSKDSESLWRRYVEDMARKIKNVLGDLKMEKLERDSKEKPDRDHRRVSPERERSERDHRKDSKEKERSDRDYRRDYRRDAKEERDRSERDHRRDRKESERLDRDSRRGYGSSDYSRRR